MLDYINLNTKKCYNKMLGHFKITEDVLHRMENYENLADLLTEFLNSGRIEIEQIMPIVNTVLVHKFGYSFGSIRIKKKIEMDELLRIKELIFTWNALDIVLVYYHPTLGTTVINPKNEKYWDAVFELSKKELLVVYLQSISDDFIDKEQEAIIDFRGLINDVYSKGLEKKYYFKEERETFQKKVIEKTSAESVSSFSANSKSLEQSPENSVSNGEGKKTIAETKATPKKMTPKYSCQVTNELFHNGNVEAWKNIIQSYEWVYSHLNVLVYHDGQKVNNLNSLFKWGKVKHGDVILFCVVGEDFKGISKLQKYLFEGASNRFEIFLRKEQGVPLKLF